MTADPPQADTPQPAAAEKPPMDERLRPFIDKSRKRLMRRPPNPGVRVEGTEADGWTFAPTHRELEPWQVQVFDAFGTRSACACWAFLYQLSELCNEQTNRAADPWRPNEMELNAALNMVSGIRPRNEVEAALAAQMVAVHLMTMKLSARALRNSYGDPRTMSVAGKLARTYAMQCETMAKLKGRTGKQKITVKYERHNHHHEHKHLHAEGEGGGSGLRGQPHGPSPGDGAHPVGPSPLAHERGAALPRPHALGDTLSAAGDQGPVPLSDSRRRKRVRRSQG